MTTDASNATTDAGGKAIRLVRRLVFINLGFVALQALSAGFLMSGYPRALRVHAIVAVALQFSISSKLSLPSCSGGDAEYRLGWWASVSGCS